jgi:hypothetical protein
MTDAPPTNLRTAAAEHSAAYGAALSAGRRTEIAKFYHYDGALIVFNGVPRRQSQSELRRRYEGSWNPPAYFSWESLSFDSISPTQVLVTGGFRWQAAAQRDTVRYIYAAMLVAVDSGLAITFEHETLRPTP